jgi:hypothetical protein
VEAKRKAEPKKKAVTSLQTTLESEILVVENFPIHGSFQNLLDFFSGLSLTKCLVSIFQDDQQPAQTRFYVQFDTLNATRLGLLRSGELLSFTRNNKRDSIELTLSPATKLEAFWIEQTSFELHEPFVSSAFHNLLEKNELTSPTSNCLKDSQYWYSFYRSFPYSKKTIPSFQELIHLPLVNDKGLSFYRMERQNQSACSSIVTESLGEEEMKKLKTVLNSLWEAYNEGMMKNVPNEVMKWIIMRISFYSTLFQIFSTISLQNSLLLNT